MKRLFVDATVDILNEGKWIGPVLIKSEGIQCLSLGEGAPHGMLMVKPVHGHGGFISVPIHDVALDLKRREVRDLLASSFRTYGPICLRKMRKGNVLSIGDVTLAAGTKCASEDYGVLFVSEIEDIDAEHVFRLPDDTHMASLLAFSAFHAERLKRT